MKLVSVIKKGQFIFIFSFICLIMAGFLLLASPLVTHDGSRVDWIDALFTATSAVCVTGLTTVTISGFNWFGQVIIIALMQLGGLGVMSLSAFIVILLGRKLTYSSTLILSNSTDNFTFRNMEELIKMIACYTFLIEGTGMVLLFVGFAGLENMGIWKAMYYSLFHAVSSFCNAGLSLYDESLVGHSSYIKVVVAGLISLGGLGIYAIYDIFNHRGGRRYMVHTKLVMVASFILVVVGMAALKYCQSENPIGWVDAFFMSVTARTAGFNSVPMDILSPSSVSILIVLMLIGACPGSTGGGIKVTAVALAFLAVINTIKGNERLVLFHREIPVSNIMKAFTMIIIYIILTIVGAVLLSALSSEENEKTLFETASAIGTVGLSLGFSMEAGTLERLLLILYMFLGRVGPFTIFLFLLGREKRSNLKYPEERIIVG